MKKGLLLFFLIGCYLSLPVNAKNTEFKFQINFDSKERQYVEIKNEILKIITQTIDQVDQESIGTLLSGDLSSLKNESRNVFFENHILYFNLGDSQGKMITGDIKKNSFCMVEVKPKSLLRKWLDFFNW